jgi:hypothetical protein
MCHKAFLLVLQVTLIVCVINAVLFVSTLNSRILTRPLQLLLAVSLSSLLYFPRLIIAFQVFRRIFLLLSLYIANCFDKLRYATHTKLNNFTILITEVDESLLMLKNAWGWTLQDILYRLLYS